MEWDSRSADNSCWRYLVEARSETDIGYDENESFLSANLVVYQGVANVLHQTIKLLHVLRIVEETGDILFGCHRDQGLTNLFQFPAQSQRVRLTLDLGV